MGNKYVPEGGTDLHSQAAKEEALQGAISTERKKKVRKTLRDQLRANAIKKNKTKPMPNAINSTMKEDLRFVKALENARHERAQNLLLLSEDKGYEYDKKRTRISSVQTPQTTSAQVSSAKLKLKVKKNKLVKRKEK
ncbi:hypothetical protein RNJ44_04379 [Nakaseomyces bracarensis]|uniref:Uncharacterized protein n=1 Tax=Nakaseomyces bracarensis TaxID=273131 RepID=A0ABR4NUV3_9SACH